jgi:hypothetical protein
VFSLSSVPRRPRVAIVLLAAAALACDGAERTTGPLEPSATDPVNAPATTTPPAGGTPAGDAPATTTTPGAAAAPAKLAFLAGSLWGTVGASVLTPPAVRVTDDAGRPVAGVRVTFAAASGVVAGAEQVTDARGVAAPDRWTLGTRAGRQALSASAPGYAPATFVVNAEAGPASRVAVVEGDGQTATVMSPLPVSPLVRVTDEYGNGVARVEVRFATGGEEGAFVQAPYLRTDGAGEVRALRWSVGRRPGSYRLVVTAQPFSAQPFSATVAATAVAGPPARLRVLEGNDQSAAAGTTLPVAPAVYVTDTWGNRLPAAGIRVVFRPFGGSGTVAGAEQLTDADGVARVGAWTLGPLQTSLEPTPQLLLVEAPAFQPNVSGAAFRATAK